MSEEDGFALVTGPIRAVRGTDSARWLLRNRSLASFQEPTLPSVLPSRPETERSDVINKMARNVTVSVKIGTNRLSEANVWGLLYASAHRHSGEQAVVTGVVAGLKAGVKRLGERTGSEVSDRISSIGGFEAIGDDPGLLPGVFVAALDRQFGILVDDLAQVEQGSGFDDKMSQIRQNHAWLQAESDPDCAAKAVAIGGVASFETPDGVTRELGPTDLSIDFWEPSGKQGEMTCALTLQPGVAGTDQE